MVKINNLTHYLALMRFDKPIGWLLLLWPTLWSLWIASAGEPSAQHIWIFTLGVIVMRSFGCVINDMADRDIDPLVDRTLQRPLAAGILSIKQSLALCVVLGVIALVLLSQLPTRVWPWAVPAVLITIAYPFMKRFFVAPQLVLGVAFSFGIPMVYVTLGHAFDDVFYLLILINILWVMVYDTVYAMSDREDDLKIGVKSTAILFGRFDRIILALFQLTVIALFICLSNILALGDSFLIALAVAAGMFVYQQWLISNRERLPCFQAFLNNGWVGGIIWFGLIGAI